MNPYVTGTVIKELREKCHLTQAEFAAKLNVSDKTVSKWETGKGLPDVSLLQPLAKELGVSLIELMNGEPVANKNISSNLLRSKFYVCPVCGNVIHCVGAAVISCCGIVLPALEAEEADEEHEIRVERVEDEHYITLAHPMTKQHFISFVAFAGTDRLQLVKLYPEGDAATRLQLRGGGYLYAYCNRHGLFRLRV